MTACVRSLAILLGLATLAGPPPVRAEDAPSADSPLVTRAKAALKAYGPARGSADAQRALRPRLVALADTLETVGEDVLAAHCLERAGILCYYVSEYDEANAHWSRGLEAARRSGDKKRIAGLLNACATGASITGDDERAIEIQTDLLVLRRELGDVRGESNSLGNLGISFERLHRYPEAVAAKRLALERCLEAGNPGDVTRGMIALAGALAKVDALEDGLALSDSAVTRARSLDLSIELGHALLNRALFLQSLGRIESALRDYEEALAHFESASFFRLVCLTHANRANALLMLARCEDARAASAGAIALAEYATTREVRLWLEAVDACVRARCGDPDGALVVMASVIERFEAYRDSIPDGPARADAFNLVGGTYTDLAGIEAEAGDHEAAWRMVEASAARVMREALGIGAEVAPDLLARLRVRLEAMNGVAIQYSVEALDRAVAIVITPLAVRAVPLRIGAELRSDVVTALRLMASGADEAACAPVLARIGALALDPVLGEIPPDIDRLVVFPGLLSGFPLETLPAFGQTLGDRFPIAYAPSASVFLHLDDRPARAGDLVVLADPSRPERTTPAATDAMRAARFTPVPLPQARAEGARIAAGGGRLLTGEDASLEGFRGEAPRASVLHLAAHALVDAGNPALSGVLLAGGTDDDFLNAGALASVDLDVDLVSLSACRTAGGYVSPGEGAFGLTRAFLVAGARSVLSSWWDVEDRAARRFMELCYEAMRGGAPRDVAVQAARRRMAAEGFSLRDRAAFALSGATGEPVATLASAGGGGQRRWWAIAGVTAFVMGIGIDAWRRRRASLCGGAPAGRAEIIG